MKPNKIVDSAMFFSTVCYHVRLGPGNSREDHRLACWSIPCRSGRALMVKQNRN